MCMLRDKADIFGLNVKPATTTTTTTATTTTATTTIAAAEIATTNRQMSQLTYFIGMCVSVCVCC